MSDMYLSRRDGFNVVRHEYRESTGTMLGRAATVALGVSLYNRGAAQRNYANIASQERMHADDMLQRQKELQASMEQRRREVDAQLSLQRESIELQDKMQRREIEAANYQAELALEAEKYAANRAYEAQMETLRVQREQHEELITQQYQFKLADMNHALALKEAEVQKVQLVIEAQERRAVDERAYQEKIKDEEQRGGIVLNFENSRIMGTYVGEKVQDKPFGKGAFYYDNGMSYEGNFVNNKYDGEGRLEDENGNLIYEGQWRNGRYNGRGRMALGDNRYYVGTFVGGELGAGEIVVGETTMPNGDESKFLGNLTDSFAPKRGRYLYEGTYKGSNPNGIGKKTWDNGMTAEGEFVDGKLQGFGILNTPEIYYEGDFKDDVPQGVGRITYKDSGEYYEGEHHNFVRKGNGRLFLPDGIVVEGEWLDNDNCYGTAILPDGTLVIGELHRAEKGFDTKGQIIYPLNHTYVGDIVNYGRHGRGEMAWANGNYFVGEWIEDRPTWTGEGQLRKSTFDAIETGRFVDGKLIEGTVEWKGHCAYIESTEEGSRNVKMQLTPEIRVEVKDIFGNCESTKLLSDDDKMSILGWSKEGIYDGYLAIVYQPDMNYEGYVDNKTLLPSKGKLTYPTGDYYDGEWSHGKWHGEGVFYAKHTDIKIRAIWDQCRIVRYIYNPKDFDKQVSEST